MCKFGWINVECFTNDDCQSLLFFADYCSMIKHTFGSVRYSCRVSLSQFVKGSSLHVSVVESLCGDACMLMGTFSLPGPYSATRLEET